MRIMALDPGAKTGFAHGEPGGKPVHGVYHIPKIRDSAKYVALERWLRQMIQVNRITAIYFEKPIMPKVTSFAAMMGMAANPVAIGMASHKEGIDCYPVDMATWRSEFGTPTSAPKRIKGTTERRKWMKAQCVARCRALGYEVDDDNEADALGLYTAIVNRKLNKEAAPEFDLSAGLTL